MPRKAAQPSLAEQQAALGGVGAVDRAVSLLDVFTPQRPLLSLAELAEGSQQYKSTVSRLLASLAHAHVVRRHADGRYSLGSAIPRLHAVYAASFSLQTVLMPALHDLVEATRETAAFHIRQGNKRLCLYGVDSPQPVCDHVQLGTLLPLGTGAAGVIFMAYAEEAAPRHQRPPRAPLAVAPADPGPEVAAIAAPVFTAAGELAGVITLTMPAMRLHDAQAAAVQRVARRVTAELGGHDPDADPDARIPDAPATRS